MTLKEALSHTAVLGADVFGNLTRMDNVIDGLGTKLEAVRQALSDAQTQLENAKTELATPFSKEAELTEKEALTQLYSSELYRQLEREETKLWHLSVPTLYDLWLEEKETGHITYPEEA